MPATAPLIVRYDGNDQFASGASGSEALTDMAGFEAALAKDKDNNDTVAVTSYDPTDASDVARFVLTDGGRRLNPKGRERLRARRPGANPPA